MRQAIIVTTLILMGLSLDANAWGHRRRDEQPERTLDHYVDHQTGYSIDLAETVSPAKAQQLLKTELPKKCFRRKNLWTDTQCFWRAEVWTHKMEQVDHVKTYKAFMFYSKKYRDKEHCGGGSKFHVTPLVKVMQNSGEVNYRTLDGITHRVLDLHTWSRIWIHDRNGCHIPSSYHCPLVRWEDYKGYDNSPVLQREWCYIVIVPSHMFYEHDLETKRSQTAWELSSLKTAYSKIKNSCKEDNATYGRLAQLIEDMEF